jgi:uncharacterized protein YqjF (DUF2071 family)
MFLADWDDVLFLHFALHPRDLQSAVPFELDLRDGRVYVSLVAFTQRRLRPAFGGRFAQALAAPLSDHAFLNVRTYVRHRNESGIYFLAEWIPNRLAAWIGPRMYGLPYKLGRLAYRHDPAAGSFDAAVRAAGASFHCSAAPRCVGATPQVAPPDSLTEFLLERYIAFTHHHGVRRRFAVRHAPWMQVPMTPRISDSSLLGQVGPWFTRAELCGAQASAGVKDVTISRPCRC